VEYQRIGAWWHGPFVSTGWFPFGGPVQERGGFRGCRVVFGTLLGPEATGPRVRSFCGVCRGTFVSGFLAAPITRSGFLCGGWCVGCVVRGCCLRTT
jgi:hypothetical protein